MAVLVIAGSGRGAGKTAVGCALMAAMPEFRWTAVKVTPHWHGISGRVWEETESDSEKDTARYLRAGAVRTFLISDETEDDGERIMEIIRQIPREGWLLVESNRVEAGRIAEKNEPAICLAVVTKDEEEWKPSLRGRIEGADAVLTVGGMFAKKVAPVLRGKQVFWLPEGAWTSAEIVKFVRSWLKG